MDGDCRKSQKPARRKRKNEKFGKFRLRQIIRQHSQFSSQEILKAITDALAAFRDTAPQNDDVTLVVAKAKT
jgi:serine phosphatase RsbU (regulator of sigma subunit)